jgi:MFS family permease
VEASTAKKAAMAGASLVLVTLCAAQFLMTLDTSVMNVAIATVAKDTNTTVTGVQTAITLYALVMAALMITGGKIGALIGRKRAFSIGCVIYGVGSFTTSLAHSLTVLIIGWSFLEGIGAALILPAIVALVASNFAAEARPKSYGLVSAAGAVAVAVGPLIGGLFTTYWSWRYVFAGEVLIVIAILILGRGIVDEPPGERPKLDVVGVILSASGLSLAVFGVLKSGTWGWLHPKSGAPVLWGVSLTMWLIVGGVFLLWLFLQWEGRREERGQEPLVNRTLFRVRQLRGGLRMFFFQYFIQSGIFFVVPLFLSVALGLSAIETGVRLLPLSITLLIAAIGVPRFFPDVSPRRVVRLGLLAMFLGDVVLLAAVDADATASIVFVPLLLVGLGIGALASQLGSVTVSAVPDELSPEVGGLQNTATNLGTSLGTALAGAVLIATLSSVFLTGLHNNPEVPDRVAKEASSQLARGIPFSSDADVENALQGQHLSKKTTDAIVEENSKARLESLQAALGIVALFALMALFCAGGIPKTQPKSAPTELILDQELT